MLVIDSRRTSAALPRKEASAFLKESCPWADEDAVLLVISELVGNAIRHTDGPWRLCLQQSGAALVADVEDAGSAMPVRVQPDADREGGRGWHIADRLTSELQVIPHDDGKTVRAVWHRQHTA
ncbi:Histidine kinase-, DNA gyrase B-, and HSP90-like ATPase [Streptomyces sp. YIM 130001]|uniref:ATP-binding protein n=1 Tax=Streptomyces sp. YIM 130001 TaxID=2259644 RepID=UPI000EDDC51A|nr:ATP-binding protein [Streptomyces sp. YIM 130001]RII17777.1 Histidine kinase-, DNA gyrase B-, and HSP90-like ATPase [Streptomyces sp. YIM 130001]